MKKLLFACLLLVALRPSAWCDMLGGHARPPQTMVMVTNLKAFPGFKFTYSISPGNVAPLQESQYFHGTSFVNLFVEDGGGKPFQWASVPVGDTPVRGISILEVSRDGENIKVRYKMEPELAAPVMPQEKSTRKPLSPIALLLLSGASLCVIVLLWRKKRAPAAGG